MIEKIQEFSETYKEEVQERYNGQLKSSILIEKEIPNELETLIRDKKIKGSVGQGNHTYYPWIGIFDERVSTGATNGFYIVILFSDNFDYLYLTLNQGSTIQDSAIIESNTTFVYDCIPILKGFKKGKLPKNSLVRERPYQSNNKGKKYEETNMFYKEYKISEMDEQTFIADLKTLLRAYDKCCKEYVEKSNQNQPPEISPQDISINTFISDLQQANLSFPKDTVSRFTVSLITKPFLILTGLSGSGKTKLAQAFVKWICEDRTQYCLVPVGADWTNREPLLGYPNALEPGKYCKPDNRILDILLEARKEGNEDKPFFIILDEMNLSHVERYFADFLSAMESGEAIPLHNDDVDDVPQTIKVSDNVYVIGTVNVDETTYMFSPKVLDRANVIEFRVNESDITQFINNHLKPELSLLEGEGSSMAADYVSLSTTQIVNDSDKIFLNNLVLAFFRVLRKEGGEFGYRTLFEIYRFFSVWKAILEDESDEMIVDFAVLQKLLPKLHGSRKKLIPILDALGMVCLKNRNGKDELLALEETPERIFDSNEVLLKHSLEKILRMKKRVKQEGFTSFTEA